MDDDDLAHITDPTGNYILAYPCGCTIHIRAAYVIDTHACPDHPYIGQPIEV